MDEKYKIGTISKLLGIPIQTLHYFETCGFVTPSKDSKSNYRYYDAWDVNFLLDSRFLRSFEFSNPEIEAMINTDDLSSLITRFGNQEKKLLDMIQHYQGILDELHQDKIRISRHQEYLGQFQTEKSPQMFFYPYRRNNNFETGVKGDTAIPDITGWLDNMPFVKATFRIPAECLKQRDKDRLEYIWGFSVSTRRMKELQLEMDETVEYCSSRQCLYTVFKAYGRNTFIPSLYEQVFKPVWERGYEITDSPVGRLLVRIHEDGVFTRFFEIWIPVRED